MIDVLEHPEKKEKLQKLFRKCDTDCSGALSKAELAVLGKLVPKLCALSESPRTEVNQSPFSPSFTFVQLLFLFLHSRLLFCNCWPPVQRKKQRLTTVICFSLHLLPPPSPFPLPSSSSKPLSVSRIEKSKQKLGLERVLKTTLAFSLLLSLPSPHPSVLPFSLHSSLALLTIVSLKDREKQTKAGTGTCTTRRQ